MPFTFDSFPQRLIVFACTNTQHDFCALLMFESLTPDVFCLGYLPTYFPPSSSSVITDSTMNTELKILFDSHLVRKDIQDFLISVDVQCASVSQFACIATKEEDLVSEVLAEAGLDRVKLQEKVAIRAARRQ